MYIMKPGMESGLTARLDITVTPDMFAQFGGNVVHHAYSTVTMVYHMEWVSRLIILPFLEEDEEGMGAAVSLKHIAPCREGDQLTIKATVEHFEGNIVLTKTEITRHDVLVGVGDVKQVILPKTKIIHLLERSQ